MSGGLAWNSHLNCANWQGQLLQERAILIKGGEQRQPSRLQHCGEEGAEFSLNVLSCDAAGETPKCDVPCPLNLAAGVSFLTLVGTLSVECEAQGLPKFIEE